MRSARIDRLSRTAIIALELIFVSGCASSATPPQSVADQAQSNPSLVVVVASDVFVTGNPRVPFVLFDGTKPFDGAQSIQVTAYDLGESTPTPGWSGQAVTYADYEIPYWVVYPELPHSGYWGIDTSIELTDGTHTSGEFAIEVVDHSDSPGVGDRALATENRTLKTEPDIRKLSSDSNPDLDLYQMTVAEALKTGLPTVVTFATPGYCTSHLCAPVVNSVKAAAQQFSGEANFIHIEVYKTFDPLVYADEMAEWGLESEPWTFVIDSQGIITARLGGPVSLNELAQNLEPELAK
jgi:hypothetical protein